MLKLILTIGLLAASLVIPTSTATHAQTGQMVDRVRLELERTDRLLQEAQVNVGNNPIGAETIVRAQQLQGEAHQLFNQKRYRLSLELTLKVREQIRAALMRNRVVEESDEVVLRRLERVTELLDRVGGALTSDTERGMRALYDAARENLQKAWDLYRGGRFRPAMKIVNQVENSARRIMRQTQRLDRWNDSFERKFQGIADRLIEFEERADNCESESAKALLEQARQSLDLARKLADEDNIAAAMQALEDAQQYTQEGMRECFGPAVVREMIARMESRLAILDERIPNDDDRARKVLDQARRQIDLAKEHLTKDQPAAAAASLRAAQQAFQKLARIAKEYDI